MAKTYKKPNKKVLKAKRLTGNIIDHALKIALCLLFAFPFYWMIITSFKTFTESILYPPTMYPHDFTFDSYIKIFQEMQIGKYLKNSLIVLFWTTLGTMLTTIPAATRIQSKLRHLRGSRQRIIHQILISPVSQLQ